MVPKGWDYKPLSELLDRVIDYRGQSVPKAASGIPLITARNVRKGYLDFSSKEYVDEINFNSWMKRGEPKPGDILFTTEAPLGNVCRYPKSGKYAVAQRTVTLRTNKRLESEFLLYTLLSEHGQRMIDIKSSGSTAKGIKSSELKKLKIAFPTSTSEQKKIAQILFTWDKAITTSERLLASSQQQKAALMQQLLTGKVRLRDRSGVRFRGEWKLLPLEKVVEITTGSSKSKSISNSGHNYVIDMGSVSREGKLIPSKRTYLESDYLEIGQLVMPKDDIGGGNIIGRVGIIDKANKYVLADHVYALKVIDYDSHFISYVINSYTVNKSLRRKANGTAQLGLGKKDVLKQTIYIPEDIQEQKAIASLLLNADEKITILRQQIANLACEKKALMQQLLTGKLRVKVNDEAFA